MVAAWQAAALARPVLRHERGWVDIRNDVRAMAGHSYEAGEYEPHSESLSREMGLRPHTLDDATPKHAYAHRRAHTHTRIHTGESVFQSPGNSGPHFKIMCGLGHTFSIQMLHRSFGNSMIVGVRSQLHVGRRLTCWPMSQLHVGRRFAALASDKGFLFLNKGFPL